jgi:hypothetical protein
VDTFAICMAANPLSLSYPETPDSSDPLSREPLSPELALVDPDLASFARKRLPDIGDSLARQGRSKAPEDGARPGAGAVIARTAVAESLVAAQAAVSAEADRRERRPNISDSATAAEIAPRVRWARALAVMTALALFGGVFAWRALRGGGDVSAPAAASSTVGSATRPSVQPPGPSTVEGSRPTSSAKMKAKAAGVGTAPAATASKRSNSPPPKRRQEARAPAPARPVFLWPSAAGARYYQVEFFRSGRKIFQAALHEPRLELPFHWRFQGRVFTLTPGTYIWQVRPVTASGRSVRYGKPITHSRWVFHP